MPGYRKGQPPANKGMKLPAEVLTREEVNRLLGACSRRGRAGMRDRAMIAVLYRCGLRVAELCDLQPRDVDLDAGTVIVRHGKGNKRRVVGMDAGTTALVATWLQLRSELGVPPRSGWLFCTISRDPKPGRRVQESVFRETLKRLARKADVHKRVHPHGFRHTNAAELQREGMPVLMISRHLGHNSLATTERYLDHLSPQERIDALRRRDWVPASHATFPAEESTAAAPALPAELVG
jgi:site-specific recombinase XerD